MARKNSAALYFQGVPGIFMLALLIACLGGLFIALMLLMGGHTGSNAFAATLFRRSRPKPIVCTDQYSPVCGTDGFTYSNSCYATRSNATVACAGECPCGSGRVVPVPVPY